MEIAGWIVVVVGVIGFLVASVVALMGKMQALAALALIITSLSSAGGGIALLTATQEATLLDYSVVPGSTVLLPFLAQARLSGRFTVSGIGKIHSIRSVEQGQIWEIHFNDLGPRSALTQDNLERMTRQALRIPQLEQTVSKNFPTVRDPSLVYVRLLNRSHKKPENQPALQVTAAEPISDLRVGGLAPVYFKPQCSCTTQGVVGDPKSQSIHTRCQDARLGPGDEIWFRLQVGQPIISATEPLFEKVFRRVDVSADGRTYAFHVTGLRRLVEGRGPGSLTFEFEMMGADLLQNRSAATQDLLRVNRVSSFEAVGRRRDFAGTISDLDTEEIHCRPRS